MTEPNPLQRYLSVLAQSRGQTAERVIPRDAEEIGWEWSLRMPNEPALMTDRCSEARLGLESHVDLSGTGFCGRCGVPVEKSE